MKFVDGKWVEISNQELPQEILTRFPRVKPSGKQSSPSSLTQGSDGVFQIPQWMEQQVTEEDAEEDGES